MKRRRALVFLICVGCLIAWWKVETRLTAARDLNRVLSEEVATPGVSTSDTTRLTHQTDGSLANPVDPLAPGWDIAPPLQIGSQEIDIPDFPASSDP